MNFDWELEEETENVDPRSFSNGPAPRRRRWGTLLAGVLFVALLAGLSWWRISRYDRETEQFLQSAVDLQVSAVLNRDGDLYFTNYGTQTNLAIHHMHPLQINFWLSQPKIESYEQVELEIWAKAEWRSAENETLYRTLFFNDWNGSVRLKETSTLFWGDSTPYETIILTNRDWQFRDQFVGRANAIFETYCAAEDECDQIKIQIGPQAFLPTDEFKFLSPHLYGLTANGEIPDSYWTYFDQRLLDLIGATTIRFGVPELLESSARTIATEFMASAEGKNISVEIISYHPDKVNFIEFLKTVDGAFMPSSLEVVTAGSILPVTELASGLHTEMFGQHWAAPWWQDQMWFLPIDGEVPFVSSDGSYSARYGNPEAPYSNWTWDEFEVVMDVYAVENELRLGIATPNPTLLLSRAYGYDHTCGFESPPISCSINLSNGAVEEALTFYQENHTQISIPPAGTREQQLVHFTTASSIAVGDSAMWLSRPRLFEHDLSTREAVIYPLPRYEDAMPIHPLRVRGGVISSFSDSPISTWHFINWLSRQEFGSADRTVPARFQTLVENGFWAKLPASLRPMMQVAFNQARPIRLGDLEKFSPDILSQVVDGSLTPAEAAAQRQSISWFKAYFPEQPQAN